VVAAVTTVASVVVASGVALAAPDGPAGQATAMLPAARSVNSQVGGQSGLARSPDAVRQLASDKVYLAELAVRRLARAERRAAARRAAARRTAQRRAAAARAAAQQQAQQGTGSAASAPAAPSGSPQQIAMAMLGSFGWSSSEFGCLQSLWNAESGWNPSASNPSSGAYGIPQALPGSKMASAGPDWQSNPATQIRWGLGYIKSTYGSPCAAWSHEQGTGWY
jgi:hypothetical protein